MRRINVIDLDSTLLPYDSFGWLVRNELKKFDLFVWWFSVLRVLRLVSSLAFKKAMTLHWLTKYDDTFLDTYADKIYKDLNKRVLELVDANTLTDTINVLLSASPDLYVHKVIKLLKWKGRGSYFDKGHFVHLYSEQKINWILTNYPLSEYEYHFAISDSKSDNKLLNMFKESIFWENNK